MTLKDLEFWGTPPYTSTLEDEAGHPIGIVYTDGTIIMIDPSKDSRVGKRGSSQGEHFEVVWDGAAKDPSGGRSKGRLLPIKGPSYIDSLIRLKHLARGSKSDDETEAGTSGNESRKKKRNSKKGK